MPYLVGNLKESVSGLLTGTNLSNVTNLNGALERAARSMAQKISLPTASGTEPIILYSNVFSYPAPSTIFGSQITDIRPQGLVRNPWDYSYKTDSETFDRTKGWIPNGYTAAFDYYQGQGIMRISTPNVFPRAELDPMSSIAGWTATGTASAVILDQTDYYQSPASLRSTVTVGTGIYTKAISSQDLSDYEDVGVAFLAIETPSAANLSSIELRLGSSSTNYNNVSETVGFLGAWQANNWTIVAFDFAGASQTGTPDWSAIDYVQIRVTAAGTLTNFRMGGLFISLPAPHTVLYESAAMYLASGGIPSTTITTDSDTILLSDSAYTIYEYEAANAIAMQMSGGVKTSQITGFDEALNGIRARNGVMIQPGLYDRYTADNPSAALRTVGTYYDVRA